MPKCPCSESGCYECPLDTSAWRTLLAALLRILHV